MKKLIFITISILTASATLCTAIAQDNLDRRLEVTRDYTPRVDRAEKLTVAPDMTDTVRLRPEGTFSITPTAWPATFPVDKFAPAQMSATPYKRHHPLYIRAGLGYPLASTFDLYYTPRADSRGSMGVFVNHTGSYSKIINDIGILSDNVEIYNGLGFFGSQRLGKGRYTITGDIGYNNRYYSYYGSGDDLDDQDIQGIDNTPTPIPQLRAITTSGFTYDRYTDTYAIGKAGGSVSFGDTFTDMTRFNFRIWLETGFSHADSHGSQVDIDFRTTMVQMLHRHHGVSLTLSERGAINLRQKDGSAVSFSIAPRYILSFNKLSITAGFNAGYIRNTSHGQHHWRFAPTLDAKYDVVRGMFVPFVSVSSRLADGSFEALSRRNPYLHRDQWGTTGTVTDLRLGFSGNIKDIFTYRVSGGASWLRDYQIFVAEYNVALSVAQAPAPAGTFHAMYSPVMFSPLRTRGMFYTVGAEVALLPVGGFSASLGANWYKYSLDDDLPAGELPNYDVKASLSYSYKGIFSISTSAHLIGERSFLNRYWILPPAGSTAVTDQRMSINRHGPVVDVSLRGEVRAMERLWVFVEGTNLAAQARYTINHYRSTSAGFIAGMKVVF